VKGEKLLGVFGYTGYPYNFKLQVFPAGNSRGWQTLPGARTKPRPYFERGKK